MEQHVVLTMNKGETLLARLRGVRLIMLLLTIMEIASLYFMSSPVNACNDQTPRDVLFWSQPNPERFSFNLEPISLHYDKGIKIQIINEEGIRGFMGGDYATAHDHFVEALKMNPESAILLHNVALVSFLRLNREKSVELWRKAASIEPNNPRYRYHLAFALSSEGRIEEAIKEYQIFSKQMKDEAEIFNNIAQLYEFKGDLRKAEAYYRHALRLSPYYLRALHNLGKVYVKKGKLTDAESVYRRIVSIDPDNVESYISLGKIYLGMGRNASAAKYFKRAISIRKDYPEIHIQLSIAYKKMGKTKESQEEEKLAGILDCSFKGIC